jgi:hypothetical protein
MHPNYKILTRESEKDTNEWRDILGYRQEELLF